MKETELVTLGGDVFGALRLFLGCMTQLPLTNKGLMLGSNIGQQCFTTLENKKGKLQKQKIGLLSKKFTLIFPSLQSNA